MHPSGTSLHEHLARIAAATDQTGGPGGTDREVLDAAADIFSALVTDEEPVDVEDYDDWPGAFTAYLSLLSRGAARVTDLATVLDLRDFIAQLDSEQDRGRRGWSPEVRAALTDACQDVLAQPGWPAEIAVRLDSEDPRVFGLAARVAREFGLDTYDAHLTRVRADPTGPAGTWLHAWRQADRTRAEELVEVARELLPLDEVPTDPTNSRGAGPDWAVHRALGWTLQSLPQHVGVGADLILLGLRSPVVSNRLRALDVLQAWPRNAWPATADQLVDTTAASDPTESVRTLACTVRDA